MPGPPAGHHHRGMSGTSDSTTTSPTVWRWTPPVSDDLTRKVRMTAAVSAFVVIGVVAYAAVNPGRATIVVAALTVSIAFFWWQEHRRFRRTTVELSADGVLGVGDGRQSGRIDLATADTIHVRRRTQSGQAWTSMTPRWVIEVASADGVLTHRIAHAAGLFNLDEHELRGLEIELRTAAGVTAAPPAQSTAPLPAAPAPEIEAGSGADHTRFEWQPPRSPNADRRRLLFRIGYLGIALAIAVVGAVSEWGDPLGVVLTASTVPGIIVVIGASFDVVLGRVRRFRIVADDGVLHVFRGNGERTIPLTGARVAVDKRSHIHGSAQGTTRTVRWLLTVGAADGSTLVQQFPSFGTTTTHDDYVALERELRRRT